MAVYISLYPRAPPSKKKRKEKRNKTKQNETKKKIKTFFLFLKHCPLFATHHTDVVKSVSQTPMSEQGVHLAATAFTGCRLRFGGRAAAPPTHGWRAVVPRARKRDRLSAVGVDTVVYLPVPDLVEMARESRPHEHVQRVSAHRENSAGVHGVVVVQGKRVGGGFHRPLVDNGLPVIFAVLLELRQFEETVGRREEPDVSHLIQLQQRKNGGA